MRMQKVKELLMDELRIPIVSAGSHRHRRKDSRSSSVLDTIRDFYSLVILLLQSSGRICCISISPLKQHSHTSV
eukprot:scaffold2794_cov100-Cylindrotheca_fusiformis.AAC.7